MTSAPSWAARVTPDRGYRALRGPRPSPRRFPNVRYWNEPGKGGHFAAFEQPALFVDEVRSFFRLVR